MRKLVGTGPKESGNGSFSKGFVMHPPFSVSRMSPFCRSVGPVLFLPDRHQLLEAIDGVPASLERFSPMRAAHRDRDADLAYPEPTQPMFEDDFANRPTATCFGFDLGHLLFGHAGIGLIVERHGDLIAGQIAYRAEEDDHRPAVAAPHLFGHGVVVDRIAPEVNHGSFYS